VSKYHKFYGFKLKILVIAPTPFFADRGAHVQIYEQANSLINLGHTVRIVTYGIGLPVPNLDVVRCRSLKGYKKLSAGPSFGKLVMDVYLLARVRRELRSFDADIIHAHLHEGAVIARALNLRKKYLVVFDYQGSLSKELSQHVSAFRSPIFQIFLRKIEIYINSWFPIVTQSKTMVEEILRSRKRSSKNKHVINVMDGVNTSRFKPSASDEQILERFQINLDSPRFIYVGYMAEYQGVDLLLRAFAKIKDTLIDAKLILIGYPFEGHYENLAVELMIKDDVTFVGRANYFQLEKYLALGQVAVAPKIADTEGDGKIYNYLAMGLPTVAFDRSVSREIMRDAGLYAKYKDYEDLASVLIEAYEDRESLSIKARARAVDALSWDAVALNLENVYKNVAGIK
jgi:glycosyltransferase involved in cell wall biosynthesis